MKLQHLAVIFVIIMVPIALVLSTYTDGLIKVINNEAHYDTVLTNATYDAIRAYQMNTLHNSFASVNNSRERDINASVNSFFNSLSLGLEQSGYTKTELNEYIPAMLFTLYDGYYVYGPFKNVGSIGTVGTGNGLRRAQYSTTEDTRLEYGLMPYTYYSCEYQGTSKDGNAFDLVINYSLDNYISVSGTYGIDPETSQPKYITASGYYINYENVEINEANRTATLKKGDRDITITPETLGEYISFTEEVKVTDINGRPRIVKQAVHETPVYYNYINYNEVKYYLMPEEERNSTDLTNFNTSYDGIPIFVLDNDVRVFINRDMLAELAKHTKFNNWESNPMDLCKPENFQDVNAFNYYKEARDFSKNVYPYIKDINIKENSDGTYGDVKSVFFNNQYEVYPSESVGEDYNSAHVKVSYSERENGAYPFDFKNESENDPETEASIFNNHRIDVIVSSIEASLVNAIGNFNNYVSNTYSYAMPTLSENDWYKIANNLTTVSFMQGLPVGRYKFYSNYSVVANKKNKEFIGRDAIYIQDRTDGLTQAEYEANYVARSLPEYHSPSCEEYNREKSEAEVAGTVSGIVGYRNIDYEEEPILNTYPVVIDGQIQHLEGDGSKRQERTQSLNYYFQPGTGAYECIISRNQNRITTDDLIGQKSSKTVRRGDEDTSTVLPISETVQTAYISALAREKGASYKHHSGLNYHRYMSDGTKLGENVDKTYNDIDQNFSDEDNLDVPTVSDPDYNGETPPIRPPEHPNHRFNGIVVSIKVRDKILSSGLVDTDIPEIPKITSITDRNIVTNDRNETGDISENTIIGKTVGQTSVFLEVSVDGITYTARSTVIVTPDDTPPPEELDKEEIRILEVATTGEKDITNTKITMLTNERMNIRATKVDSRDILTATSSDTNKIRIQQWNNVTDRGIIKANAKTLNPVTVTVSGNMIVTSTGSIATGSFECDIVNQVINLGNISISAGETKTLGTDPDADIKIDLVREERLIYEIYNIPGYEGVVTLDSNNGTLTGNKQGSAILVITGETSGMTRQVIVTVTDDRAIYFATLHTDGTLAFANTEAASRISGKAVNKTYKVTLGNEQKFITNSAENNNVSEVRFIEQITVRGPKIEWFTNWPNLTKLVNENYLVTDNITDMRKMFYKCAKLGGNLNLNSWNTSKVQYMERMFEGCASIENISLSNWNTENVRDMQYMFKDCQKLQSITANATASSWNVNNVLKMQYMFNGCLSLKTAILYNWDAGNVDDMEYMFADCIALEEIHLSTWNTQSLRDTRYMFSKCKALKTVIANSSAGNWTTAKVENMSYMFKECENVTNFALNNWDTRKAEQMQSLFSECSSIQSMNLSSWITSARTSGDNKEKNQEMMFNNCTALRTLDLTEWTLGKNVVSMFNNCKSLQTGSFYIARVKTTATTDMANMFSYCESLNTLNLVTSGDYWNVSNVTRMVNMFRGCKGLTSINLDNWDVRSNRTFDYMFNSCSSLQSINLESWNNDWYADKTTLRSMFSYCSSLKTLYLSKLVNQKVSTIANMFESCSSLESFTWNSWSWDVSRLEDMSSFLRGCGELKTVDLDLSKAGGEVIVDNLDKLYTSCRKLTNVSMTNWKANQLISLNQMYDDCRTLQTVTMTNWEVEKITTLNRILADKEKLTTVNISNWRANNLTSLISLFENSEGLATVDMYSWNAIRLTNVTSLFDGAEGIVTVNISNWNVPSITNINGLLASKSNLRTVNISNWKANSLIYVSSVLLNSNSLVTIDMSNWEVPSVINIERMLAYKSGLTTVNLSNWRAGSLTSIDSLFANSDSITTLNMSNWQTQVTNLSSLLSGKWRLTTADFSNWSGAYLSNMNSMFYNCSSLRIAYFTNTSTYGVTDMRNMFYNCSSLQTVYFNALNTTNVSMDNLIGMFMRCRDGFTIVINSQENYYSGTRGKLKGAYDENPETYYTTYQYSYRYRIFGHYVRRELISNWWDIEDRYRYYWVGTVNFVVY